MPRTAFPMNSRSTSPVGAITAPAWASRNNRSTFICFEKAAPPQTRMALEMVDRVVDARRETVGVDLHGRELGAQSRQALAEALAQMLEAGILKVHRRRRHRRAADAQRHGRGAEIEQWKHHLQHGLEARAVLRQLMLGPDLTVLDRHRGRGVG